MFGKDRIDSQYFDRMEARERELRNMIERKEKSIEQRIAGENGQKDKAARERKSSSRRRGAAESRVSIKRSRSAAIQQDTSKKTQRDSTSVRTTRRVESQPSQAPWKELIAAAAQNQSDSRQSGGSRTMVSRPLDRGQVFRDLRGQSRSARPTNNSKTIGRVIRTVVILYVIFGLFAGIMPRIVGNLGEFVTDLRDEIARPEPEYEVVTQEAVRAVDQPVVRTDSVDFILKVDVYMENLDEAQSYLANEYTADVGIEGVEGRFNRLLEEKAELMNEATPPSSLDAYWEFFMMEFDWTLSMLEKTINGESIDGDYERLNLLQYDKFAELVRVWNEEGVAYEVDFRQYDYALIPKTN